MLLEMLNNFRDVAKVHATLTVRLSKMILGDTFAFESHSTVPRNSTDSKHRDGYTRDPVAF